MKKHRNILITLLFVVSTFWSYAQSNKKPSLPHYDRKPYHFGFVIGINQMDFTLKRNSSFTLNPTSDGIVDMYSVEAAPMMGFNVGIITNLRLNDHFDFRFIPELSFGDRNLVYTYKDTSLRIGVVQETKKIESTFVEFPFLLKYKGVRLHNVRPYLIGGLKYSMDLASQAKKKKDEGDDESIVKLKRDDIAVETGVGFDFYLKYFKFATEVKMSYGLTNVLKKDPSIYTNPIDKLNSKIFILSFLFE